MKQYTDRATFTIKEVAAILGIGRAAAYEAVRTGRIPSLHVSTRRIVVPRAALERLLGNNAPVAAVQPQRAVHDGLAINSPEHTGRGA